MNIPRWPIITAILFAVALVVVLLWKHDGDVRRDGRIAELTHRITLDSVARDSLTQVTKAVDRRVAAASDSFTKRDTLWRRHRDTVEATVTEIVSAPSLSNTIKIEMLSAVVRQTTATADSAIHAAEILADSVLSLRKSIVDERAGWQRERGDQATKVQLLERQSRHWGLGGSIGYGAHRIAVTDRDGTKRNVIASGPQITAGVVYRW